MSGWTLEDVRALSRDDYDVLMQVVIESQETKDN